MYALLTHGLRYGLSAHLPAPRRPPRPPAPPIAIPPHRSSPQPQPQPPGATAAAYPLPDFVVTFKFSPRGYAVCMAPLASASPSLCARRCGERCESRGEGLNRVCGGASLLSGPHLSRPALSRPAQACRVGPAARHYSRSSAPRRRHGPPRSRRRAPPVRHREQARRRRGAACG